MTNASERWKKNIGKKLESNNSKMILSKLYFNPKSYINVDLLFNLKKTSGEKIVDRIIEKLLDDNE